MNFLKVNKYTYETENWESSEVTYLSDVYQVRALMIAPKRSDVKYINVYLRGGKGQVGNVRLGRLLQFMRDDAVVVGPYYRGSNRGEGMDELAGADVRDVTALIAVLRARYPRAKVNLIGFSRGGIQALNTLKHVEVDGLLMVNAVSSIYQMYEERQDLRGMMRRIIGHPEKDSEAYDAREAIDDDIYLPKVLIIHGRKDRHVDIKNAEIFVEYLEERQHPYTYEIFEGEVHALSPPAIKRMKRLFWEMVEK